MASPNNLKFSKEHQWLALSGTKARIGLTDFATSQLGDIVFIELPHPGDTFHAGDTLGVVESTKTASDIFFPVSGKVLSANDALIDAPETINSDPYGKGWLVEIECSAPAEVAGLMDADAYRAIARK